MSEDYEVETTVFRYKAGETHKFVGGSFRITDRYEDWEGTPQYIIEANLFTGKSIYPLIWSTTKVLNAIEDNYEFSELFEGYTKSVELDEVGYGSYILSSYVPMKVLGVRQVPDSAIGVELLLQYEDEDGYTQRTTRVYHKGQRVEKII